MDLNFSSHSGLRGVASIWIMLFHAIIYSKFPLDFQGSSIMPLFFLLSGYYMMISSFGRNDDGRMSLTQSSSSPRDVKFNTLDFHRNRFARDTGAIVASIVTNILPLNTTFIYLLGVPINGPGFWPAFALATMNPFTRFPLFLMGAYAGELTIRIQRGETFQWSNSFLLFFPYYCTCCCQNEERIARINYNDQKVWTQRATTLSLTLLVVTLLVAVCDGISRYVGGSDGILGCVWFQAIVPFAQLEVIVALTLADKSSLVVRALSTPVALWLGEGTTLVWPPTQDCDSIKNSNQTEYDDCVRTVGQFNDDRLMPIWGIPIVVVATLVLATALFHLVEEPCRKLLRKRRY
eukprot:gene2572-5021_t